MADKNKALVLYSGGMDSFLAAVNLIVAKYHVTLLSINGGGLAMEENLLHGVERLQAMYGPEMVEYAGVYPTTGILHELSEYWNLTEQRELGRLYPNLTNCQVRCLNCQTSMWIAAMAYALAKDISCIACGYKKTDVFCTGCSWYWDELRQQAKNRGLILSFPVIGVKDDFERSLMMERFGFEPSVLEPKCLLGTPPKDGVLPDAEQDDMQRYFQSVLVPEFNFWVNELQSIFKHIKLGNTSWGPSTYQMLKEIEAKREGG